MIREGNSNLFSIAETIAIPGSVGFTALDESAYARLMGRWSRKLAPPLIQFGGLSDGDRFSDVGCGTRNLILLLPQLADISEAVGIGSHSNAQCSSPCCTG